MTAKNHSDASFNRRDFVKLGAVAGLGAAIGAAGKASAGEAPKLGAAPNKPYADAPIETVRVGFVGAGGMGTNHIRNLLRLKGVELKAVCDINSDNAQRAQKLATEAGQKAPTLYTQGEEDFKRMCAEEDLDLVYTATPWRWHVPVMVAAMENGKHAATEVPATWKVEECWQMVEVSEKTQRHCVMMENCCYNRPEMMIFNMVRKGLFGEILHGECGYLHDLRGVKFGEGGEGLWRREHSIKRNGNLYPTHGLGPVAQAMDINRGDQFDYMVSMSSPSRGLQIYRDQLPEDDPRRKEEYICGDVNTSLIKTKKGRTITLVHDCNLPRPYSRVHLIQGTKGITRCWPNPGKIHIEGRTEGHGYEDLANYNKEFDHPLWQANEKDALGAGHGGMDYIEDYRLIHCLQNGLPTDMDVYDAAAWSVVGELSERSVANRSNSVDIPDFTRGWWKTREPLGIIGV